MQTALPGPIIGRPSSGLAGKTGVQHAQAQRVLEIVSRSLYAPGGFAVEIDRNRLHQNLMVDPADGSNLWCAISQLHVDQRLVSSPGALSMLRGRTADLLLQPAV